MAAAMTRPQRPRRRWRRPSPAGLLLMLAFALAAAGLLRGSPAPVPAQAQLLLDLARDAVAPALLAALAALLLRAGLIDLSAGCVLAAVPLAAALLPGLVPLPLPSWAALPAALLPGLAVGLVNGWLVARRAVPSVLASLLSAALLIGLATLAHARFGPIAPWPPADPAEPALLLLWDRLGRLPLDWPAATDGGAAALALESLKAVPMPLLWSALIVLLLAFGLGRTAGGNHALAVGEDAATASRLGIVPERVRGRLLLLSGLLAALAGLVAAGLPRAGTAVAADAGLVSWQDGPWQDGIEAGLLGLLAALLATRFTRAVAAIPLAALLVLLARLAEAALLAHGWQAPVLHLALPVLALALLLLAGGSRPVKVPA